MRPLEAQVTEHAHDGSSKSPHLPLQYFLHCRHQAAFLSRGQTNVLPSLRFPKHLRVRMKSVTASKAPRCLPMLAVVSDFPPSSGKIVSSHLKDKNSFLRGIGGHMSIVSVHEPESLLLSNYLLFCFLKFSLSSLYRCIFQSTLPPFPRSPLPSCKSITYKKNTMQKCCSPGRVIRRTASDDWELDIRVCADDVTYKSAYHLSSHLFFLPFPSPPPPRCSPMFRLCIPKQQFTTFDLGALVQLK